ncbi:MFS transporter [Foetidibacter luteolus]|uniref:MFS transporter n=1 Tax=Foetidibacter luteolus TaxID=2608880 RepID=UPI00129BC844|nr:MFS transporter [Foetidibacter luteolus]
MKTNITHEDEPVVAAAEMPAPGPVISTKGLYGNFILRYITGEIAKFKTLSVACRRLLVSNFVYIITNGIVGLVSASFIFRLKSGDIFYNMINYFGAYLGTTVGFFVTGMLLKKVRVNYLYSVGMLFNACSFIPLLFNNNPTVTFIIITGFFTGMGNGMYWSNRHYMTILSTENKDRNYMGGIDSTLMTIGQLLAPVIFGIMVATESSTGLANLGQYKMLFVVVTALFLFSAWNIMQGRYQTVPLKKFVFFKYNRRWNRQSLVNIFEGLTEGATYTIPPILILMFVGAEDTLGTIETISVALSTLPVYLMGRYTKPRHRVYLLTASVTSLLIGTTFLAVDFGQNGVLTFYAFNKLTYILNAFVYVAIRMRSVDVSKAIENRDEYAYIFNSELFTELGRLLTIGIFCFVFFYVSKESAQRYIPLAVAILQLLTLPLVRKMSQE